MTRTSHHRWSAGLVGTLLLVSIGLLYGRSALFVLAIVPLGYVAYEAMSSYPDPAIQIERDFSALSPPPGSKVTVTVTVTNTGERMLPDVRVVDNVPAELTVMEEAPRASLAIPAGESRTFAYTVRTKRGDHTFGDATVRVRSLSGSRLVTSRVTSQSGETLSCSTSAEQTPLLRATNTRTGTLPIDSGGPGLEFHSTREYRSGDPTNRIDWRRFARTDELSTINFREERVARLVLVVDARPATRVAPQQGYPTGTELAVDAAERIHGSLTAAGHKISVTALGLGDVALPQSLTTGGLPWVAPTDDRHPTAAARELFEAIQQAADGDEYSPVIEAERDPSETPTAPTGRTSDGQAPTIEADGRGESASEAETTRLKKYLPPDAQVVLVTPVLDDEPVSIVETIRTHGVPVTVISPGVPPNDSLGERVSAMQRQNTLAALRDSATAVIDWPIDEPLETAIPKLLQ